MLHFKNAISLYRINVPRFTKSCPASHQYYIASRNTERESRRNQTAPLKVLAAEIFFYPFRSARNASSSFPSHETFIRAVTSSNTVHRESKIRLRNRLKCVRQPDFPRQFAFCRSRCFFGKKNFVRPPTTPRRITHRQTSASIFPKINAPPARRKLARGNFFPLANSHVSAPTVCNLNVTRTQPSHRYLFSASPPSGRPRFARPDNLDNSRRYKELISYEQRASPGWLFSRHERRAGATSTLGNFVFTGWKFRGCRRIHRELRVNLYMRVRVRVREGQMNW